MGVANFLNFGALLGWSLILCILLLRSTSSLTEWTTPFFEGHGAAPERLPLIDLLMFLEAICFVEVGRIALGQIKGNLVLGVVLHMIRLSCLILVLPGGLKGSDASDENLIDRKTLSIAVLYGWSLTEVGRYPMYIFPSSSAARYVRLVLPIFTFPVTAAAEAIGAYRVLTELLGREDEQTSALHWAKVGSLVVVVLINSLLGPTQAYPALLKKGLPVLMGKTDKRKTKKS
ncbi:hypothetical protein ACHAWF_013700 [Thalassiosira exigua]